MNSMVSEHRNVEQYPPLTFDPSLPFSADLLGTELVQQLVSGIQTFLSSQRREVVRSTLVLVKVTIGVLPRDDLAPHVESLVRNKSAAS